MRSGFISLVALIMTVAVLPAHASELTYTFLDFQYLQQEVQATGTQNPVPVQTVSIDSHDGDGIAIDGSLAIGSRFFAGGGFRTSIIDVEGLITNPLTEVQVSDNYDVIFTRLSAGYLQPIGTTFDLIVEISYDSTEFDFGSFAGENFDVEGSGAGARAGFRWNPTPPLEIFASARYSPTAEVNLNTLEFEAGTMGSLGVRWYFFEDLGLGIDYEAGDFETIAVSLRFGFGNLPW
jgi:hypothetical protein